MPTSFSKRQKERNRQDKQREKDAKRDQRRVDKTNQGPKPSGEDPDIAGIIPGPQPLPEE